MREHGSETLTNGFRVGVHPRHLPEESLPGRHQYLFRYDITVTNESERRARLISREWWIVDADGGTEHIAGEGVVGEQPLLLPGQSHRYHSFCTLPSDWGTMEGRYRMLDEDGEEFDVTVGRFYLVAEREPASV